MDESRGAGVAHARFGLLPELWRGAVWLLGERWRWLFALPILAVLGTFTELVTLLALARALLLLAAEEDQTTIDLLLFNADASFRQLAAVAAGAAVVSMGLRCLEAVVVGRLTSIATAEARERCFSTYFRADWQQVATSRRGRLQQVLGQNAQLISQIIPTLGTALSGMLSLAVYGVVVLVAAPQVGVLFLVLGGTASVAFAFFRRRLYGTSLRAADAARDVQLTASTLTTLNRELHVFGVTEAAIDDLSVLNQRARRELRWLRTSQRLLPVVFIQTILLLVVVVLVLSEALGIDGSSFGAAAILAVRSLTYLQQVNNALQLGAESWPYAAEVRDFVDEHRAVAMSPGDLPLGELDTIELRDVAFSYGSDAPAISGLNLTIRAGEWVGIVGPSGGGKTTLVNLLAGLVRPTHGEHLVNGQPASSYSSESWKGRVALLSQEPALLRGTIERNISFYRPIDAQAVRQAADEAAIRHEIDLLPHGFETNVGDGEAGLSGGQRQRIALARVIVGQPDLLILDEPTSALDAAKEEAIEAALERLEHEPIVVVASHRPALLRRCDRFVVIEGGQIVACVDDYAQVRGRVPGDDGPVSPRSAAPEPGPTADDWVSPPAGSPSSAAVPPFDVEHVSPTRP